MKCPGCGSDNAHLQTATTLKVDDQGVLVKPDTPVSSSRMHCDNCDKSSEWLPHADRQKLIDEWCPPEKAE